MTRVSIPQAIQMAQRHLESGQLREAEAIYLQILQLEPNNIGLYGILAEIFRHQGKDREAVDILRRAVQIEPKHVGARIDLANALKDLGEIDEAIVINRELLS